MSILLLNLLERATVYSLDTYGETLKHILAIPPNNPLTIPVIVYRLISEKFLRQ